jgi:hypothetical protein
MSEGTFPQSLLVCPGQCVITSYSSGDDVCAQATALCVVLYGLLVKLCGVNDARHESWLPEVNTDNDAL